MKSFERQSLLVGNYGAGGASDIVAFAREDGWDQESSSEWSFDAWLAAHPLGTGGADLSAWNINATIGSSLLKEAARADVDELGGDFNGDGRGDFLFTAASGLEEVALVMSSGSAFSGQFQYSHPVLSGIGDWLQYAGRVVVGDYNGDGKDDLALFSSQGGQSFKVAQSNGDGTFTMLTRDPGTRFAVWAADWKTRILPGDYNGDGKDDLMLFGKNCYDVPASGGGTSCQEMIPVVYGGASGFTGTNHPSVPSYQIPQAPGAQPNSTRYGIVEPVVGDFNHDGRDELVTFRMLPVPSTDEDWFPESLGDVVSFGGPSYFLPAGFQALASHIMHPGATPVTGDFNNDGKDDIAVVGSFNKNHVPMLLVHSTTQTTSFESQVPQPGGGGVVLIGKPGNPQINVPAVRGGTLDNAYLYLNNAGLPVGTVSYQPSCMPAGTVASATPEHGTSVEWGTPVNLVVYTASSTCAVPDVVGWDINEAREALLEQGFVIGTVTNIFGPCVANGTVASTNPQPGTVVARGSTINYTWISSFNCNDPDTGQ